MFRIEPTKETKAFFDFVKKEIPDRIKTLEYVVATWIGEWARDQIKAGINSQEAYIQAYRDSLHLVQVATHDFGAVGIVGTLPLNYQNADSQTTLVMFPPGGTDPVAAVLGDPRLQPWAMDTLPPVTATRPVLLRLRPPQVVAVRRAETARVRPAVDAALTKRGVAAGKTFVPGGGAFLDVQDLALQLEHGGESFPNVPHWKNIIMQLKSEKFVATKVLKDLQDAAQKALTDPSYTGLAELVKPTAGSVTIEKMGELDRRPGGLTGFAAIVGGYPLQ